MKVVNLTPGLACKCPCRKHKGSDGDDYWYNLRKKEVYTTDCHKKNPVLAKGTFKIKDETIIQI